MMENQSHSEVHMMMLPPPPGTFRDREELINHVREFGVNQGYVVTIKNSKKDSRVLLGCDRGGVQRSKHNVEETKRKRKSQSRLINCPFEATGKREDDVWVLTIKNGEHNHEPIRDMSEHPCSRRFTEEEVKQIKLMTEAGLKPRQVLKALKKNNPELRSTPRHLYNVKAKIRQGNFTEKSFKSWRPTQFVSLNTSSDALTECNRQRKVRNLIGGKFVDAQATAIIDVVNPATQEVVSQVPLSSYEDFRAAVDAAKRAFPSWKRTPASTRRRIMFKFQELIHRDINKLAMRITIEQGKTLDGAKGDVLRGLEVVEQACGMAGLQAGEFISNDCNGIDTYCIREPLGVCAGICAPNFPAVISLWMFPIAVTCGNTFILKPCEKSPGASMILAELALEAGLPDGVLNIIHGTNQENVAHICNDDDIKAISIAGSSTAAMHIYPRAAARGKRVQSNTGARNHAIILPDASVDATLDALVAAGFGAGAQRCMTLSTAIFVGGSMSWEEEIVKRAKALKLNVGTDPSADLGPVSVREEKDRICRLVQRGVESGARVILDGRSVVVPGYESGNFVGPTVLCDVTTSMECYKEEMSGPVVLCMQAESIEDAIAIVNRNRYEIGASIFTTSDVDSRYFLNEIEAGLVGINVPVPVPLPFSSFNGAEASHAGDLNFNGKAGMQFYTHIKTVARKWKDLPRGKAPLEQPLTSENEISSRQTSLVQPITSESDFLSSEVSPASLAPTSRVPNPVALPPTTARDLPNLGMLLDEPLPTESQLPRPEMSQSNAQAYETMHMPQSTPSNETSANAASERMYLPTSHPNVSLGLLSSRTETAVQSLSETMYASNGSFRSDDLNLSRTSEIAFSSGENDGTMASSSSNAYAAAAAAQASDGVAPQSGRHVPAKTPRRFIPHQMVSMDEYQRQ